MPTTPRLGLPYPDDSNQNDVTLDLENLAIAIEAVDGQSLLASRPAAGVVGRRWYVTDSNVSGGFFYDTGTIWLRVTPSPWVSWAPTVGVTNGGNAVSPAVSAVASTSSLSGYLYRVNPGNAIEISIEVSVALGGQPAFGQLFFTSPIPSTRTASLYGSYQNDIVNCTILDMYAGNAILLSPTTGHNAKAWQANSSVPIGQWTVPSTTIVHINGTYPV